MAEKFLIQLFLQLKLPYLACINEQVGGGASTKQPLPEEVKFGVYLCYNLSGIRPFIANPARVLNTLKLPLSRLDHLLGTASPSEIDKNHLGRLRPLQAQMQHALEWENGEDMSTATPGSVATTSESHPQVPYCHCIY